MSIPDGMITIEDQIHDVLRTLPSGSSRSMLLGLIYVGNAIEKAAQDIVAAIGGSHSE